MSTYPQIKETKYHDSSFDEIDKLRIGLNKGEFALAVNKLQSMLYLNQMKKSYSLALKLIFYINILSIIGVIIFLFINWRYSIILFVIFITTAVLNNKLAIKFIIQQCLNDKVFLKFALAVGLVKIQK